MEARIVSLEGIRLQLLRDLRDRAQVLGKQSQQYFGLSSNQAQQLNEYAARLRKEGPDSIIISNNSGNYAGLKKQLRDATSTISSLRKAIRTNKQEKDNKQRLAISGRWGSPAYLRNSYDNTTTSNAMSVSDHPLPPRSRRNNPARNVTDLESNDELSALRLTCSRLKTELGLPSDFKYEDLDTYSMSEVERANAGVEELERQNEALEAERTALIQSNQTLQSQQIAAQEKINHVLSNQISSQNNSRDNNRYGESTTTELTKFQSQYYQLQLELNRTQSTIKQLQTKENRANKIMASQQRRSNELIDCTTELTARLNC